MQATLQFLATFCCAIFAGAAIYINAVEHPARMSCGVRAALAEWAPSYKRATVMQASLAVLGFAFAVAAWLAGAEPRYLVAGIILLSVAPFTLIVIMPTNKRLMALDPGTDLEPAPRGPERAQRGGVGGVPVAELGELSSSRLEHPGLTVLQDRPRQGLSPAIDCYRIARLRES